MDEPMFVMRLSGELSLTAAVRQVELALQGARDDGARQALIDIRGLTGFQRPGLTDLLDMVRRWSTAAGGKLKVAFISRRELNDPERFGVVLAGGLGFSADVFETEAEALAWLEEKPALWTGPPPRF